MARAEQGKSARPGRGAQPLGGPGQGCRAGVLCQSIIRAAGTGNQVTVSPEGPTCPCPELGQRHLFSAASLRTTGRLKHPGDAGEIGEREPPGCQPCPDGDTEAQ